MCLKFFKKPKRTVILEVEPFTMDEFEENEVQKQFDETFN